MGEHAAGILTSKKEKKTRPDTRQSSRGRLGRSSNAKTRLEFKNVMDLPTNLPTDTARFIVAWPRLKMLIIDLRESFWVQTLFGPLKIICME